MHRPRLAAAVLAIVIGAAGAVPALIPRPTSAAGECGVYRSESVPPSTIRVLRTASGAVETVDFGVYVKNVLSREWISSWTTESLRSGALAVKHYAWYQVVHWRGYLNGDGECFDVFDSTRDQLYDPSRPTYAAMASAVDSTWTTLALRAGALFPTYYNAGSPGEACGANANGWQMHQWGTQACGLDGLGAAEIMAVYYSGVTVTDAPPAETPPPTPMPTPAPSPADPAATPIPTPTPEPTPPPAAQPGGGQVDLVAPPPPPPPDPEPVLVLAEMPVVAPSAEPRPPTNGGISVLEANQDAADARTGGTRNAPTALGPLAGGVRLRVLRSVVEAALGEVTAWLRGADGAAGGPRRPS